MCTIRSEIKIFNFLTLDTCHLDTLHLCQQICEDLSLFYKAKRGPQEKNLGNTARVHFCAPFWKG